MIWMENKTINHTGKEGQAIYSVSRGGLNAKMIQQLERRDNAAIHYHHKCIDVELEKGRAHFENTETGEKISAQADVIFATDGAFSAARYNAFKNWIVSITVRIILKR